MLIALEGLEGVGKTTIGQMAAQIIGATYIKSPSPELNPVRGFVAASMEPLANFYFYLSGLIILQNQIQEAMKSGPVIVDRYIDSTIAYHNFGSDFSVPSYERQAIRMPDLTVEVYCDEEVRNSRKMARGVHIFNRHHSHDSAISSYFSRNADLRFENSKPVEQSATDLAQLILSRLGKDV